MKLWWTLVAVGVGAKGLPAQRLEARLGAIISSTLVEDNGATFGLVSTIPANYRGPVKLKLAPAPIATVGLVQDLSGRASLELMASVAISTLRTELRGNSWDTQDASMAAFSGGIRYAYKPRINLHGGLGVTRLFSEDTGVFSEGSSTQPMLELGISTGIPLRTLPLRLGARLQTHRFGTPALRREGASDGRVVRLLLQAGVGG